MFADVKYYPLRYQAFISHKPSYTLAIPMGKYLKPAEGKRHAPLFEVFFHFTSVLLKSQTQIWFPLFVSKMMKIPSRHPVSGSRFEIGISQVQSSSVTATFNPHFSIIFVLHIKSFSHQSPSPKRSEEKYGYKINQLKNTINDNVIQ